MMRGLKVWEAVELRRATSYYEKGCVLIVALQPSLASGEYRYSEFQSVHGECCLDSGRAS